MRVEDWLKSATKILNDIDIASARLDALVLLEDAVKNDRAWLLANPDFELNPKIVQILDEQIIRRASYEPLAYIRGRSEFYGREFRITPATLQPRPETETMLELFLIYSSEIKLAVDVGTGSGAIAITAKLERPNLKVFATEINQDALKIARINANKLAADVNFYKGNLLEPLPSIACKQTLAILANLPYVPDDYTINESAMQEPVVAIFGGKDGLELYRRLLVQIDHLEHKPRYIFTESLPTQHAKLRDIALRHNYHLIKSIDLIQLFATTPVSE